MKTKFIIVYFSIFLTFNANAQWNTVYTNNSYYFTSTWFLNIDTGFAVTGSAANQGEIIKTVDGGLSWTSVDSGIATDLKDISFISNSVGYAVGQTIINSFFYGIILKTSDGGDTWTTVWTGDTLNPTVYGILSLHFPSPNVGYATLDNQDDRVLKTVDGGSTWNSIPLNATGLYTYHKVFFLNEDSGFVVSNNTYIQKTINGGASWSTLTYQTASMNDIFFLTIDTGFLVCGNGYIDKTVDGCSTFSNSTPAGNSDLYSVYFTDRLMGYVFGNSSNTVQKTIDGGTSWHQQQVTGAPSSIEESFFLDHCRGYAVGRTGTVIKTLNGGLSTPAINLIGQDTLNSSEIGNRYSWFLNGVPINDSTQFIIPTQGGEYSVLVEDNGCFSDTSNGFNFSPVGISQIQSNSQILNISPNPVNMEVGNLRINFTGQLNSNSLLEIFNQVGKRVYIQQIEDCKEKCSKRINLNEPRGFYYVRLFNGEKIYSQKLIIQ